MATPLLTVQIITQSQLLKKIEARQLTAPAMEGEVTILPGHIPLFTKLEIGEVRLQLNDKTEEILAVQRGFLDVRPDNQVYVIVDQAVEARALVGEKIQQAIKDAQSKVQLAKNQRELLEAEAQLRYALLQEKIAQRRR
jgi:F-type H+-transporting ATPase subunit epsilon